MQQNHPIESCHQCGVALAPRILTHVERVGRVNVTDRGTMRLLCPEGHAPELTFDEALGYERRAVRTVLREGRHVDGAVMRFARKALGLKQVELAAFLDVDPATVSRWENDKEPAQRSTQLAVASLVERAIEEGCPVLRPSEQPSDTTELEVPVLRHAC